ncbi:MAG: hypothetical protein ACUVT7_02580 [Thermoplasmata archaeon]
MDAVDIEAVKRRLRFDYMKVKTEPPSRTLDLFTHLLSYCSRPQIAVHELIQDTANRIQKHFRLRWVMIGLRSQIDGLYRYEVEVGMRPEAWARQRAKSYKLEDFDPNSEKYKAGEISKLTRVYLEEENPLFKEDEQVVNRPVLLRAKRRSEEETLEADFIDTLILGPGEDLLGWIEYSGTITGEFPDPMTIRNIEVMAAILGAAISSHARR